MCMWRKFIWNPSACTCKTERYLISSVDDLVIKCDEIIDVLDVVSLNLYDKKEIWEMDNTFYQYFIKKPYFCWKWLLFGRHITILLVM